MASLFMLGTLFACSFWLNFHFLSGKHAMGQNPIGWVELPFAARPSLVALPLKAAKRVRVAFGAVRKVTNARLRLGHGWVNGQGPWQIMRPLGFWG